MKTSNFKERSQKDQNASLTTNMAEEEEDVGADEVVVAHDPAVVILPLVIQDSFQEVICKGQLGMLLRLSRR